MKVTFKPLFIFVLISSVVVALLLLGNWQLRRLDWKTDLIERVNMRVNAAAIAAPGADSWHDITVEDHEYLHVFVEGEYLLDRQTQVWAATELGNGYWIITPLKTDKGEIILINRGFIPLDKADQFPHATGHFNSPVIVNGLLRLTEPGGIFLRDNDPENHRWYSRDVQAIATSVGITNVAPYFIDARASATTPPDRLPIAGLTRIQFNNPHLVYALTWYGLALLLVVMSWYAFRRRGW